MRISVGGAHPEGVLSRDSNAITPSPPGACVRRREILDQGFPPRNLMNDTETITEPVDALVAEIIEAAISRRAPPHWTDEERESDWLGRVLHGESADD